MAREHRAELILLQLYRVVKVHEPSLKSIQMEVGSVGYRAKQKAEAYLAELEKSMKKEGFHVSTVFLVAENPEADEIFDVLNRLLEAELMALEYYRIHAEAIPEKDIAEGVRGILPAEENHAITLARRIRELGGVPIEPGGPATTRGKEMGEESRGQGTLGMLKLEMQREQQAVKDYCVPVADIIDDIITLEMLEEQLFDEMRHAKWLKQKVLKLEESK